MVVFRHSRPPSVLISTNASHSTTGSQVSMDPGANHASPRRKGGFFTGPRPPTPPRSPPGSVGMSRRGLAQVRPSSDDVVNHVTHDEISGPRLKKSHNCSSGAYASTGFQCAVGAGATTSGVVHSPPTQRLT